MEKHLGFDDAQLIMYDVLSEFGGDYKYESCPNNGCSYVSSTCDENFVETMKPSCLVGQILFRAGVDLEWLKERSTFNPYMRELLVEYGLILSDRAYDTLAIAQENQDQGAGSSEIVAMTWSEAWFRAKGTANRIFRYDDAGKRL